MPFFPDSLIVFAGIGDDLRVEPGGHLELRIEGPFAEGLTTGEDNLVIRAARLLADHGEMEPRAQITLTKNLPIASGIGGGSADAAAALHLLCRLWRLSPAPEILLALATELGADVPVCLHGEPSYIGGIGERIDPAPRLPETWLVLVNPGVAINTPDVFRRRAGEYSQTARLEGAPATIADLAGQLHQRRNDLGPAAIDGAPVIAEVLETLDGQDGVLLSRLSGSGATCFALMDNEAGAVAAAQAIQAGQPAWWVRATPIRTAAARIEESG